MVYAYVYASDKPGILDFEASTLILRIIATGNIYRYTQSLTSTCIF